MKIATWNVNSIRSRLEHATDWLQTNSDIDLLCVQETKVVDEQFPLEAFTSQGYTVEFFGQKSYNGVALIAKAPLEKVRRGFSGVLPESEVGDLDAQKRVISAVIQGVQVVNVYVPNGSEIGSEKYEYKLAWLKLLKKYLAALLEETPDLLICGDFNIALEDIDLHNPEKRATHIMASDVEREALRDILTLGLQDAFRKFNQEPGQYSWWDYRAAAFPRDKGWRIDHHYLTPTIYDRAVSCVIDKAPRELEKPSDHTPVIVELQ
jgi:exodeoxyribonuclease III